MEQGQAHIPAPATTPRIPGGHPLPTSLWDTAWLAEESPRRAAMGAPMSCSPFHLHSHEGPGDGVPHFCWHSTALQHWHPIFGMEVPVPECAVSTLCPRSCLAECFPRQLRVHFDLLTQHAPASSSLPLQWHFPYSREASPPFSLCGTLSPVPSATQAEELACDGKRQADMLPRLGESASCSHVCKAKEREGASQTGGTKTVFIGVGKEHFLLLSSSSPPGGAGGCGMTQLQGVL